MKKKPRVDIREIYEEMEAYLLASLKRNLERHRFDETELGYRWMPWQTQKLADLAAYRRENREIIFRYWPEITGAVRWHMGQASLEAAVNLARFARRLQATVRPEDLPPQIVRALEPISPAIRPGVRIPKPPVQEISVDVSLPGAKTPQVIEGLQGEELRRAIETNTDIRRQWAAAKPEPDSHFFRTDRRRMDALIEATEGELADANRAVLRRMDDLQREIIARAEVMHLSGTLTTRQAIDKAAKDFLARGIDAIRYKDGRRVNVASYAEMALRTARHRAYLTGEGEKRRQMGISTVLVSSHATSCPKCIPFQGKILIDDVYSGGTQADGKYPLLSEAIDEGFLHPNCRHNLGTYYAGLSSLPLPDDDVKAAEWYRAEQTQRRLERQIRAQKRILKGQLDRQNEITEKQRLKVLQERLRQHLSNHPQFRRKPERETA